MENGNIIYLEHLANTFHCTANRIGNFTGYTLLGFTTRFRGMAASGMLLGMKQLTMS